MTRLHLKMFLAATLLLSAFAFGMRAGERVEASPFQRSGLGLVLVLAVHGLVLAPTAPRVPGKRSSWVSRQALPRALCALAVLGIGVGGWGVGTLSGKRAFAECLERGEEVRAALAEYREEEGSYPETLADLELKRVGDRWLNEDLLEYRAQGAQYVLSFKDRSVEHRATEAQPFTPVDRAGASPAH